MRAAARILEKGGQGDLMNKVTDTRDTVGGRDWTVHSAACIPVPKPHYNTCLEEILAATGENGERKIVWDFYRRTKQIRNLEHRDPELGTKDTPRIVWEMRIRDLEEDEG